MGYDQDEAVRASPRLADRYDKADQTDPLE